MSIPVVSQPVISPRLDAMSETSNLAARCENDLAALPRLRSEPTSIARCLSPLRCRREHAGWSLCSAHTLADGIQVSYFPDISQPNHLDSVGMFRIHKLDDTVHSFDTFIVPKYLDCRCYRHQAFDNTVLPCGDRTDALTANSSTRCSSRSTSARSTKTFSAICPMFHPPHLQVVELRPSSIYASTAILCKRYRMASEISATQPEITRHACQP